MPERGPREGFDNELSAREKEKGAGEFLITFPDGTTARFHTREEAAEAVREWREAA